MVTALLFIVIILLPPKIKDKIILFILILSFYINSILPRSFWIWDVITIENLLLLYFIGTIIITGSNNRVRLTPFAKSALILGLLFWVIQPLYLTLKDYIFLGIDPEKYIITGIKSFGKLIACYGIIIYALKAERNYILVFKMIFYAAAFIALSAIFITQFEQLGFETRNYISEDAELGRKAGLSIINVNELGALLVIVLGALSNIFLLKKINFFEFLILAILINIGILFTGSRTALFLMILVWVLLLIEKRLLLKKSNIIPIVTIILVSYFIFTLFGQIVTNRLQLYEDVEYIGLGVRIEYWKMYWNDMIQNPHYFLIGNTSPSTYFRYAHNYYITLLFQSGILMMGIMFVYLVKVYKQYRLLTRYFKIHLVENPIYINLYFVLIPQLLMWIPGVYSIFQWTVLIIGLLYFPAYKSPKTIISAPALNSQSSVNEPILTFRVNQ